MFKVDYDFLYNCIVNALLCINMYPPFLTCLLCYEQKKCAYGTCMTFKGNPILYFHERPYNWYLDETPLSSP